jgi:hypothetical protein
MVQPYLDFWAGFLEQSNATSQRLAESVTRGADPQAWQRRWLETVSRSIDAYLRSPFFLSAMKHNMDAMIQAKAQVDDLQKEFARNANMPTASDVSGVYERLRGIEDTILLRLGEVEKRLETIASRPEGEETRDRKHGKKSGNG